MWLCKCAQNNVNKIETTCTMCMRIKQTHTHTVWFQWVGRFYVDNRSANKKLKPNIPTTARNELILSGCDCAVHTTIIHWTDIFMCGYDIYSSFFYYAHAHRHTHLINCFIFANHMHFNHAEHTHIHTQSAIDKTKTKIWWRNTGKNAISASVLKSLPTTSFFLFDRRSFGWIV